MTTAQQGKSKTNADNHSATSGFEANLQRMTEPPNTWSSLLRTRSLN